MHHEKLDIYLNLLRSHAEGDRQLNSPRHVNRIVVETIQWGLLTHIHLLTTQIQPLICVTVEDVHRRLVVNHDLSHAHWSNLSSNNQRSFVWFDRLRRIILIDEKNYCAGIGPILPYWLFRHCKN